MAKDASLLLQWNSENSATAKFKGISLTRGRPISFLQLSSGVGWEKMKWNENVRWINADKHRCISPWLEF